MVVGQEQFVCSWPIQNATRNGRPFTDSPIQNKTILNVRVVHGKRFGNFAIRAAEEQDGFVDWIR